MLSCSGSATSGNISIGVGSAAEALGGEMQGFAFQGFGSIFSVWVLFGFLGCALSLDHRVVDVNLTTLSRFPVLG